MDKSISILFLSGYLHAFPVQEINLSTIPIKQINKDVLGGTC